jgi:hypothetical protein
MNSAVQIDETVLVKSYKLIKVIIMCIKTHIIIYIEPYKVHVPLKFRCFP